MCQSEPIHYHILRTWKLVKNKKKYCYHYDDTYGKWKVLIHLFCKIKNDHKSYEHSDGTGQGPGHVTLTHVIDGFPDLHRYVPKNQITNSRVKPPANTLSAPICRAFCSAVHSFFQYLFIVCPFFKQDHGIEQNANYKYRCHHAHASCILWCFFRRWQGCLDSSRPGVATTDHARAARDHSPACSTRLGSNSIDSQVFLFVPCLWYLVGGPWKNWTFTPSIMSRLLYH